MNEPDTRQTAGLRIAFTSTFSPKVHAFVDVIDRLKQGRPAKAPRPEQVVRGRLLLAGSYRRVDVDHALGGGPASTIHSPRLGGTVYVDHDRRKCSPARPDGAVASAGAKIAPDRKPAFSVRGRARRLRDSGKSPWGETRRWELEIDAADGRLALLIDTVPSDKWAGGSAGAWIAALLPLDRLGDDGAAALSAVRGLPVRVEIYRPLADGDLVGTLEVTEVEEYSFAAEDFAVPADYECGQGVDASDLDPRWHEAFKGMRRNPPGSSGRLPPNGDGDGRLPRPVFPIDAGIAFARPFFLKLGRAASAVGDVFSPILSSNLGWHVDWFERLLQRLEDVGRVNVPLLRENINLAFDITLRDRVAQIDNLNEFPELRDILTADERAALAASIAQYTQPDRLTWRWLYFTDSASRLAIVDRYVHQVVAPPLDLDFRPNYGFDTPLRVLEEVDEDGNVVAGSGVEIGRYSFFRDERKYYLYHLLGIINITVFDIWPRVWLAPDVLPDARIRADHVALDVRNDRLVVDFDFWTEPAGTWVTLVTALCTLGVAYFALWNIGSGSFHMDDSRFPFDWTPRGDGTRIRNRLTFDAAGSQLPSTFFTIGWNPLGDVIELSVSAIATLFSLGSGNVGDQIRGQVQAALSDNQVLEFPTMFTAGDPNQPDPARRYLQAPKGVAPLVTAGESVYYRGTYALTATADPKPFDPHLPFDGAYVFRAPVLAEMVRARLALEGRTLSVTLPAVDAPLDALIVDEVRNAPEFGPDLLNRMVELGLMDAHLRDQWLAYLQARSWLIMFEGEPGASIRLLPPTGARLRTFATTSLSVTFPDGVDGLPLDAPAADVQLAVTLHNVADIDFVVEDGRRLFDWLRFYETNVWGQVPLPPGVTRPSRTGSGPVLDTYIRSEAKLHVGLWAQGQALTPGFPASFDFSAVDWADPTGDQLTLIARSEHATRDRARIIRDAAKAAFPDWVAALARPLATRGRYLAFLNDELQVGAGWRITDPEETTLRVRTIGQRLYLDFEIDPLIVANLGAE